jgi:hypothetical protein
VDTLYPVRDAKGRTPSALIVFWSVVNASEAVFVFLSIVVHFLGLSPGCMR